MGVLTIGIFCLFIFFQLVYFLTTFFHFRKKKPLPANLKEKGISILIPAYNEEMVIHHSIDAVNELNYKNFEALIINDGSKDGTMDVLSEALDLKMISRFAVNRLRYNTVHKVYQSRKNKQIFVLNKTNGGKADALNAGTDYAKNDIVLTIDADSMLEKDSLGYISESFNDTNVIAAGGTVHIAQGVKKSGNTLEPTFKVNGIVRFQILQYINSFFIRKFTQSKLGAVLVLAGAFGAFKKNALFAVNGYRSTVGEDMDITLKLQNLAKDIRKKAKEKSKMKQAGQIIYVPEAVCYTECPDDMKSLFNQRFRWQRAFIDCLTEYWNGLFNTFGFMVGIYFVLDGLLLGTLTAFSTILTIITLIVTGSSPVLALMLFGIVFVISFSLDIFGLINAARQGYKYRGKELLRVLLFLPINICFFRMLGIIFNIVGTISYFIRDEHWGKIKRRGNYSITIVKISARKFITSSTPAIEPLIA